MARKKSPVMSATAGDRPAGSPSTSSFPALSWAKRRRTEGQSSQTRSAAHPAVTIAIAKKKGSNAVWVANAVLRQAEELRRTIVPDDMELVVTRNYGLTANEKVNELVEALAVAILIVVALLDLGLGLARGPDRGRRRAGRLRADAGGEPDAGLHDQPRHAVCPDPFAGAAGRRSRSSTWRTSSGTSPCARRPRGASSWRRWPKSARR